MTIKTISHSKSIETYNPATGLKTWYKFDMTGELDEGEARDQAKIELIKEVNDSFKLLNPDLSPHEYGTGLVETVVPEKEIEIGDIPALIENAPDKKALESFKYIVKGKPELEILYLNKLEELSK